MDASIISIYCLSLATKMEEKDVPLLLASKEQTLNFFWWARTLKRVKPMLLATLQWKKLFLTPFSFMDYFIHHTSSNGGDNDNKFLVVYPPSKV